VAAFAQALGEGERLAFPPAIELSFGAVEVAFAKVIFAVALRCWKENPAKRPHFHQLEAEFAVHHTVVTTTTMAAVVHGVTSVGAGGRAQVQLPNSTTNASSVSTSLDSDGYVMDTGSVQLPSSTTNAAPFRNGIADRNARKPSIYLGFEEGPPSSAGLDAGETRL
jgi:hypothetical protein